MHFYVEGFGWATGHGNTYINTGGTVSATASAAPQMAASYPVEVVLYGADGHVVEDAPIGILVVGTVPSDTGYVTAWGNNASGESTVPSGLTDIVQVAAGRYYSLALKSDGTVVALGRNWLGQTDVPADLTDVIAIAAGGYGQSLAVKSDGTVVGWGRAFSQVPDRPDRRHRRRAPATSTAWL